MKKPNGWVKWLVPIALGGILSFAVATDRLKVHVSDKMVHKDVETLDTRYMPRELLEEKFKNIESSLARIEKALGTKGD